MDLELRQLDLRYEALRKRSPKRERLLLGSLAMTGQLLPIVVVRVSDGVPVVIDGYKRIRALRRLAMDTVRAAEWTLNEAEALLLERLMRQGGDDGPLEQGWLLQELRTGFELSLEELARRFDKSASWVSRRLALVQELPASIQEHVRSGQLCAHAAMKFLVPLARANCSTAERLATAAASHHLSSRKVGTLCRGWVSGNPQTRELIVSDPLLYLRVYHETKDSSDKSPVRQLIDDIGALGGLAHRAQRRLQQGLLEKLLPPEREEVERRLRHAEREVTALHDCLDANGRPIDAG